MMNKPITTLGVCLALAGCGGFGGFSGIGGSKSQRAQTENVLPFKGKLTAGEDPLTFSVAVEAISSSVEDVRESVRFEGTKYCLGQNGSSDIEWELDSTTQDWAVAQLDGTLFFNGRCVGR